LEKQVFFSKNRHENRIDKLISKDKVYTKRLYSRGRSLEIDKIEPNEDYTRDNIVLSCYWCNNAKTDEYTYDEFKRIGVLNRLIWENRYNDTEWSSGIYNKLKKGLETLDNKLNK
jgi:5-methylcytosine-specific restriction endonuclease McrA